MNPDFELLVRTADLDSVDLEELRGTIAAEYPADPMMQEIRLVRSLHALADKRLGFTELLKEMRAELSEEAGKVLRLAKA